MKITLHVISKNDTYTKTVDIIDFDILFIKRHMEDGGLWALDVSDTKNEKLNYIKKNEWLKIKREFIERM